MRKTALAATALIVLVGSGIRADDTPKPPTPQKEHLWLKQLEGDWETEGEMLMGPGKEPVKCKGTDSTRTLGGFWSVGEMKGEFMGAPVIGVMTIGYDAHKKKYVGTWVCSMCDLLWKYEGTVDGQALTLETEGPNPATGKLARMKDVIELKGKDQKVTKSYMLGDDGKWVTFMTMTARRKK